MSNKTILPCPCCGSSSDVYKQGHREYGPTFTVECRGCGLRTTQYDSEDEAIKHWNTRIDNWIPCSEMLPPQPEENPLFSNRRIKKVSGMFRAFNLSVCSIMGW